MGVESAVGGERVIGVGRGQWVRERAVGARGWWVGDRVVSGGQGSGWGEAVGEAEGSG